MTIGRRAYCYLYAVLILGQSIWAMEIAEAGADLPEEIWLQILNRLDPKDFSHVSAVSIWFNRLATDETLWSAWARSHMGDDADRLKDPDESWQSFVARYHGQIKHVRNMENWTLNEVQQAIAYENYVKFEQILLNNLENTIIKFSQPLINNAKDLAAVLTAIPAVYFHHASFRAKAVAISAAKTAAGGVTYHSAQETTHHDPHWYRADHLISPDSCWRAACEAAEQVAILVVKNIGRADVISHIDGSNQSVVFGTSAWTYQISRLYVYIYISQSDYIEQYFMPAFKAAKNILDADNNFSKSASDIYAIYGQHTWAKPEYSDDIYMKMMHRIVKRLVSSLNKQRQ